MISVDTNILFAAVDVANPDHGKARGFLELYGKSDRFCLCEQVLMELYCLLRNPKVCKHPLPAERAVAVLKAR
jgi:predicted nucleic acid-binding protein